MRIGVLRTQVPFVMGGAERHAANLVDALNAFGHEATEITIPFKWYPGAVLADNILAARMLDLTEVEGVPVDMLIGLKFPAYLVPHPNKLFWVIHQHRQAYDQWDLGTSDLLHDEDGAALRELIREEDRRAFAATDHPIYANSSNVTARMQKYLGVQAQALYHPPPNADAFYQGEYGDYIFAPGRINPSKRLELLLRSLAEAKSNIKLIIAGVAENPSYQKKLYRLARELGVGDQVSWLGAVSDEVLLQFYANARAIAFVPQDEDYGYITLEAMLAGKPVITVTDAGGPLEFITDKTEGLISAPNAKDIAQSFIRIMEDSTFAERLGQAGYQRYQNMNISWEHVVETFTGSASATESAPVQTAYVTKPSGAEEAEGPTAQDQAVMALSEAIAPPAAPKGFPFENIAEVLNAYAFEELPDLLDQNGPCPPADEGLATYLQSHWTRFMSTLDQLQGLEIANTLDVGVFPPLVFQALLANHSPGVKMQGLWEGPNPFEQKITAPSDSLPDFDIRLEALNSERDPWPYTEESFDLVTAMEVLEHLALDPYFAFAEAARVLKPGGHFLVTTPNVVSHRGVWKMLNGIAPYSFGIFVPSGGVYGRHNREYAPQELAEIGTAAGFETVSLKTLDVYDRNIDPATAELLMARGDDLSLRGETIFYLARKTGKPTGTPLKFYHGDPTRMSGTMEIQNQEAATGLTRLKITNQSSGWWGVTDQYATCLLAEWINPEGVLRHQHLMQPFTAPTSAGQAAEITLRLDAGDQADHATGVLRLHLYQAGVGVFTGTGRSPTLSLPCSEQAFVRLVRSTPQPKAGT